MTTPNPRGFAGLSSERRSEIASMGGKTAHQLKKAHQFSSEEAQAAGRKGAAARAAKRKRPAVQGGA
jgi:general stress protein YciG